MTYMEKEIHDLVFNQLKRTKRLDRAFVNDLIYIYLSNKNMDGYIKERVDEMDLQAYTGYDKTNGPTVAAFDAQNRKIYYSKNGIADLNYHLNEKYSYGFTKDGMFLLLSLYVTQIILHELEHAFQHKQVKKNIDTFEGKLLTATKPFEINQEFLKANYTTSLSERLAQIRSLTTVKNIIKEEDLHENFYSFFNGSLVIERLKGFSFDDYLYFSAGPTLDYMDELIKCGYSKEDEPFLYQKDKEKALLELYGKYTTDERIDFGLPILKQEYEQAKVKVK